MPSSKKPIIAVDIDEVLLAHFQGLINWYNQEYGTVLTLAHNHPTDPRPWGTDSIPEAVRRVHRYFETDAFKSEKPFEEALHATRQLSFRYDLIVITARDEIIEQATHDWLEKYFPLVFKAAHFTAHYSLTGKKRSKVTVALAEGAQYLIEDDLEAVATASKAGITGLLFGDYLWNQTEKLPSRVIRVKDWQEVLEYFDGKDRQ